MKLEILIIEDDLNVVEAVSLCLQLRWPEASIDTAYDGATGLDLLKTKSFDFIILDINLPDINGFEVLKQIRSFSYIPVIIVTVRDREDDMTMGLELGADDYIVKPFRPRDLVSRVNAVRRRIRTYKNASDTNIITGNMTLDFSNNTVTLDAKRVVLTAIETRILSILMKNAGQTISNEDISKIAWGTEENASDRVRLYISRIRRKLSDVPPRIIISERGVGYRILIQ